MRRLLVLLLLVSGLGFIGRGGIPCDAVEAQPRCLVALLPGPTGNTLDIVQVAGDTSTSTGELLLTTVSVDPQLSFREWLRGSFDDRVEHLDRELIYPPGATVEAVRQQNVELMALSQLEAMISALRELGYEFDEDFDGAEIVEIADFSAAADGRLKPGDIIVELAGTTVPSTSEAVAALARFGVDDVVDLVVLRDGDRVEVEVPLVAAEDDGRPVMGVTLRSYMELPVEIEIDAGVIGGPSAGLMFAIAIVDELTPDDLTGGLVIAGTGEIDRVGNIGPIGGIRQKILGATGRSDGPPATVFLVPAQNMSEATTAIVAEEVLLIPVATLHEALVALETLRGGTDPAGSVRLTP